MQSYKCELFNIYGEDKTLNIKSQSTCKHPFPRSPNIGRTNIQLVCKRQYRRAFLCKLQGMFHVSKYWLNIHQVSIHISLVSSIIFYFSILHAIIFKIGCLTEHVILITFKVFKLGYRILKRVSKGKERF